MRTKMHFGKTTSAKAANRGVGFGVVSWFLLLFVFGSMVALNAQGGNNTGESAGENFENRSNGQQYVDEIELNLYFLIEAGQEGKIIETLQTVDELPDSLWSMIFRLAKERTRQDLRAYLFARFSETLPGGDFSSQVNRAFFEVVDLELNIQLEKTHHTKEELARITSALSLAEKWKIELAFYECASFIAYPLAEIRKSAYRALAAIADDRMYPLVLELAGSSNPVERTYALDALYYIQDERVLPVVLRLLRDDNKSVRYYVVRTLEKMAMPETYYYFIKIASDDSNDEVRVRAIEVLGRFKPKGAYTVLNQTVFDDDPGIRNASIDALVLYNYSSAGDSLSEQLYKEDKKDLKLKLIQALLSVGNSGKMKGLNKIMAEESDVEILLWALYVSGQLKDERGVPGAISLLKHPDAKVRAEAALALSVYRNSSAVAGLLERVNDDHEKYEVQAAALYALHMIDEDRTMPEIFDISEKHENLYIRLQAKQVMGDMLNSRY